MDESERSVVMNFLDTGEGGLHDDHDFFALRASRRGGDRESFRKNLSKKLWFSEFFVRAGRSGTSRTTYMLSKFQPWTPLGGTKNIKKVKKLKF